MLRLLPAATIVPTVWRRRGNWTQWKDPIAGTNDPKSGLPLAQTQRKLRAWGMTSTYEHLCCEMNSFTWTIWRYKHRYCIFQMLSKWTRHASCFVVGCSTRSSLCGRFAMLAKCEGPIYPLLRDARKFACWQELPRVAKMYQVLDAGQHHTRFTNDL